MLPHPDCIHSTVLQLWLLLLLLDCNRNWQFDSFLLFATSHSISQKLLRCLRQLWLSATHTHSHPQVFTNTHTSAHNRTKTVAANSESHLAFCGFCGPDRRPLRVDIDDFEWIQMRHDASNGALYRFCEWFYLICLKR